MFCTTVSAATVALQLLCVSNLLKCCLLDYALAATPYPELFPVLVTSHGLYC